MGELNRIIFVTATDVQASNFDTSSTSDVYQVILEHIYHRQLG